VSSVPGGLELAISGTGDSRKLEVFATNPAALRDFTGTTEAAAGDRTLLTGPLSEQNARAVRKHIPGLDPKPIGLATSAGVGDRLGLATPGHVRAFRRHGTGIVPVFAQQSIREMERLHRTPQQVLDDATFGCLQAGWTGQVGADADHLKSTEEIDRCLGAGFTSFTLDPGEHVNEVAADDTRAIEKLPWRELEDDRNAMLRRYAGVRLGYEGGAIVADEEQILHAAAKYGEAVAYAVRMYRHLQDNAPYPVEVEISVDETDDPTTLVEHLYIATELKRLGVKWTGFAPRYIGGFEKGIDYIGDPGRFFESLRAHTAIARELGPYKISLHSGSDKFSIYELAAEATDRMVHLKTSGTSYLEAVSVAARFAPDLFRKIYEVSCDAYRGARASYQVSALLERVPEASSIADAKLPRLLDQRDSRQILHVGYGAVLTGEARDGRRQLAAELRELLAHRHEEFEQGLESHLGRHLRPFAEADE
jgi:hypothetical protein